jgi:hypothetical protein
MTKLKIGCCLNIESLIRKRRLKVDTKSDRAKEWLKFHFPVDCEYDESKRASLKRFAAGFLGGACCPFYLCCRLLSLSGHPCDAKTAEECLRRCEEFYEKYIKEEEN